MRTRQRNVGIRLTENEFSQLEKLTARTGLSKEELIRKLIFECKICEAPPADFITLIRETKRIGSNIEQVLRLANAKHLLDVPRLRKDLDEWEELQRKMWEVYRPVNN